MRNKKGGRTNSELNNLELENLDNNAQRAIPITKILSAKKKYSAREKKLKNMNWGMGLEHECQFFYMPLLTSRLYPLNEIVLFNSLEPTIEILNESKTISQADRDLLLKLDFELTGRKCHGKVVLDKTPISMPEFITENPFSSISNPRTIYTYFQELLEKEERFIEIMSNHDSVHNFINNNYRIVQYPFGMANNIRVRKNYNTTNPSLDNKKYKDYCGSFHFTITLPFKKKNSYTQKDEEEFRQNHYNFGAMFQWIEPLLLAAYFSCDQSAVGSLKERIRGSFRVARVGWGNFAGSDMRNQTKGTGRYATVLPYWRKNFDFYESNIVDECMPPNPKLKEKQAVSSFSSNIRTFGPDPNNPDERVSGAEMKIPNGMEFRIFDHFETGNLISLMQIIILIAANSYRTKIKNFVYEDKDWIKTIQNIMLKGWKSPIDPIFIKKLENELKINLQLKSYRAYDVLVGVVDELYKLNKDSDVVFMMCGNMKKPFIPKINKYSWDFAFLLKIVGDKTVYEKYLKFLQVILLENSVKKFKENVVKIFGSQWKNNTDDILWFLEGKKILLLNENETKYDINKELLKEIIQLDSLKMEIQIQLKIYALMTWPNNKTKFKFFHFDEIRNRYKDLINFQKY